MMNSDSDGDASNQFYQQDPVISDDVVKELRRNFETLKSDTCALGALKLLCCDADVGIGVTFSSACCHAEVPEENDFHCFTNIFPKGEAAISNYLDKKEKPVDQKTCHLLNRLLTFISNIGEVEETLQDPRGKNSGKFTDTEWMCRVAVHFLSKLTISSEFTLNNCYMNKIDDCPCGCSQKINWGDISIGNERTWHGQIDVLLGSCCDLICKQGNIDDQNAAGDSNTSPDGLSEKVKISPLMASRSEMLSQTIVSSFLQRKRHPKSHLIPSIGISKTDIKFFFYDSVNDVFLESPEIPLFSEMPGKQGQLNKYAVMATWLVVNYKFLISPITDDMKSEGKFGFLENVKNNLYLYQDCIDFGQIIPVKFPPTEPWRRPHVLKKLKTSHN